METATSGSNSSRQGSGEEFNAIIELYAMLNHWKRREKFITYLAKKYQSETYLAWESITELIHFIRSQTHVLTSAFEDTRNRRFTSLVDTYVSREAESCLPFSLHLVDQSVHLAEKMLLSHKAGGQSSSRFDVRLLLSLQEEAETMLYALLKEYCLSSPLELEAPVAPEGAEATMTSVVQVTVKSASNSTKSLIRQSKGLIRTLSASKKISDKHRLVMLTSSGLLIVFKGRTSNTDKKYELAVGTLKITRSQKRFLAFRMEPNYELLLRFSTADERERWSSQMRQLKFSWQERRKEIEELRKQVLDAPVADNSSSGSNESGGFFGWQGSERSTSNSSSAIVLSNTSFRMDPPPSLIQKTLSKRLSGVPLLSEDGRDSFGMLPINVSDSDSQDEDEDEDEEDERSIGSDAEFSEAETDRLAAAPATGGYSLSLVNPYSAAAAFSNYDSSADGQPAPRHNIHLSLSESDSSGSSSEDESMRSSIPSSRSDQADRDDLYDFTRAFQEALAALQRLKTEKEDPDRIKEVYSTLIRLGEDFRRVATEYGRIIINERYLPNEHKTIKVSEGMGGVLGGQKYVAANILFKFAADSGGIFRGAHEYAAKVAGHELKGLKAYFQTCEPGSVHFPLMALIDYKGFRLIASSLLPLGDRSLKYGSEDGGKSVHLDDPRLTSVINEASRKINLKSHLVSTGARMSSPIDLEGHVGKDGKFYLLDFSRVLPPVKPEPKVTNGHLFQMFRAEFVISFPYPLCSDGYSTFCNGQEDADEHCRELNSATHDLLGLTLTSFARELGALLRAENELEGHLKNFRLTEELHRAGINVRYLGEIVQRMGSRNKFAPFLVAHMCARVIKQELRAALREKMASYRKIISEPYRLLATQFLNTIFSNTDKSKRYWRKQITKGLEQKFNLKRSNWRGFPDDLREYLWTELSNMDLRLYMFHSLRFMTGIRFNPSLLSLMDRYPDVWLQPAILSDTDLISLGERVKHLDIVNKAKGRIFTMVGEEKERDGYVPAARGMYAQALSAFEDAVSSSPLDPDLLRSCALSIMKIAVIDSRKDSSYIGNDSAAMVRARRYFTQAIRLEPQNPLGHLQFARLLALTKMFDEAEDEFLRALCLAPSMESALLAYGDFLVIVRDEPEVAAKFKERVSHVVRYSLHDAAPDSRRFSVVQN